MPGECSFVTARRHCTVPRGKFLFFPIANSEFDNLGVDPPLSEEEARALLTEHQNTVDAASCTVNGHPIRGLTPPDSKFRVESRHPFSYDLPEDDIYELFGLDFPPQTMDGALAQGYYLLLAPLPRGEHTIQFAASFNFGFGLDITYDITVE